MSEVKSLGQLERWGGSYPGGHEFSTLANLQSDSQNTGLDDFREAANRVVENWQGNQFAGLCLYGTPGNGKTHAAIALGRALHDKGAEVHYRYAPTAIADVNSASWTGMRYGDDLTIGHNARSVFPEDFTLRAVRNPRSLLIFDDYQPRAQRALVAAVDAAAQYGGFVVVTSNYEDPFKLVEPAAPEPREIALEGVLRSSEVPDLAELADAMSAQRKKVAEGITAGLRSRIASGFNFIQFTGEDRRMEKSFWQ